MSSIVLDLWDQALLDGLVQYSGPEVLSDQTGDDQRLNRLYSNVSRPTIIVHSAAPERATGAAVVVFPGGGYRDVWIDKEGHDVARWLNTFGVTAVVAKYRTPSLPEQQNVRERVRLARPGSASGLSRTTGRRINHAATAAGSDA